jgi:four helix bundle protein
MGKVNSYKELIVWQKSIDLVVHFYELLKLFPENEKFALSQQIKRSSISIPSNIAEGWGRKTEKSFDYFLSVTRGSLYELQTQVLIAAKLNYISMDDSTDIENKIDEIGKMTNALMNKLKTNS